MPPLYLKVGKEQFSEESQGAVTLRVLLDDKNHNEPSCAAACFSQGSKAAVASALPMSKEATSREKALSASSTLFLQTRCL